MHPQLTFEFEPEAALSFDSFWAGDNALVLDRIVALADGRGSDKQLYVHGAAQTGKTHLLFAACQKASRNGYRIAYLPAADIANSNALEGLADFDLICIDDLHQLPQHREAEIAVFGLINAQREQQGCLLLSSRQVQTDLGVALPDLRTRLSWGASFGLSPVGDESLQQALRFRVRHTGSVIGDEVLDYLCTHFSRDLSSMLERLRKLDRAAVQAKRKITIPLVREVLLNQDEEESLR